jgi:hypothetical protein
VTPQRRVRRRPARGRTVAPPRVCGNVEVLPIGSVRTSTLGGPRPLPRHYRAHQPLHPQLRISGKVRITTTHVLSPSPRRSSCSEVISTATGAGEQAGMHALTSAHNEVDSTRHYVGLGHKRFYLSGESVIADYELLAQQIQAGRSTSKISNSDAAQARLVHSAQNSRTGSGPRDSRDCAHDGPFSAGRALRSTSCILGWP